MAVDDKACLGLMRLLNEPAGRAFLVKQGIGEPLVNQLDLLGISGIANLLSAIKLAKWYEMDSHDIVLTVFTDSMELYQSRLEELRKSEGEYTPVDAAIDFHRYLGDCSLDHIQELSYWDRRRIHNLKYYTWVEQQGKTYQEIQDQWYEPEYWKGLHNQADRLDQLIEEFNGETGLLRGL
jgi:hypothetical protein